MRNHPRVKLTGLFCLGETDIPVFRQPHSYGHPGLESTVDCTATNRVRPTLRLIKMDALAGVHFVVLQF